MVQQDPHYHPDLLGFIAEIKKDLSDMEVRITQRLVNVENGVKYGAEIHERFINRQVGEINSKLDSFQTNISDLFVTRAEFNAQFEPIKRITYLFVTLVSSALVAGVLGLLFNVFTVRP